MPILDMPLHELYDYKPTLTAETDFDIFWEKQLEHSKTIPLNAKIKAVPYPTKLATIHEVVYEGTDGSTIHGWYIVPKGVEGPMPVNVIYHGYSHDRGNPSDHLQWAAMGMAAFIVDTRGQAGQSANFSSYPAGSVPGWMTLGILDQETYYYKNVYIDCVRALDFVCSREEIDSNRIIISGGSQGGGLSLAVAGLDSRPKLMLSLYPYLCHFKRAVEMHTQGPYNEIKEWFRRYDPEHELEEQVYRTLSYFDGMNFATRVKAKTQMAITLQDLICPPSSCFAAYNHLNCEKKLIVYPDHGHEQIRGYTEKMMKFIDENL